MCIVYNTIRPVFFKYISVNHQLVFVAVFKYSIIHTFVVSFLTIEYCNGLGCLQNCNGFGAFPPKI